MAEGTALRWAGQAAETGRFELGLEGRALRADSIELVQTGGRLSASGAYDSRKGQFSLSVQGRAVEVGCPPGRALGAREPASRRPGRSRLRRRRDRVGKRRPGTRRPLRRPVGRSEPRSPGRGSGPLAGGVARRHHGGRPLGPRGGARLPRPSSRLFRGGPTRRIGSGHGGEGGGSRRVPHLGRGLASSQGQRCGRRPRSHGGIPQHRQARGNSAGTVSAARPRNPGRCRSRSRSRRCARARPRRGPPSPRGRARRPGKGPPERKGGRAARRSCGNRRPLGRHAGADNGCPLRRAGGCLVRRLWIARAAPRRRGRAPRGGRLPLRPTSVRPAPAAAGRARERQGLAGFGRPEARSPGGDLCGIEPRGQR